ncbi:hypothetical protein NKH77_39220 [Streptomyces sp. M19]
MQGVGDRLAERGLLVRPASLALWRRAATALTLGSWAAVFLAAVFGSTDGGSAPDGLPPVPGAVHRLHRRRDMPVRLHVTDHRSGQASPGDVPAGERVRDAGAPAPSAAAAVTAGPGTGRRVRARARRGVERRGRAGLRAGAAGPTARRTARDGRCGDRHGGRCGVPWRRADAAPGDSGGAWCGSSGGGSNCGGSSCGSGGAEAVVPAAAGPRAGRRVVLRGGP